MLTKEITYYLEMHAPSQLRPSQVAVSDVEINQANHFVPNSTVSSIQR